MDIKSKKLLDRFCSSLPDSIDELISGTDFNSIDNIFTELVLKDSNREIDFVKILTNIDRDAQLNQHKKDQFYSHLKEYKPSKPRSLKEYCEKFFHDKTNQQLGNEVKLDECLGHLITEMRLLFVVFKQTGLSNKAIKKLILGPIDELQDILDNVQTELHQIFSFLSTSAYNKPVSRLDIKERNQLPCVLGIEPDTISAKDSDRPFVIYTYDANSSTVDKFYQPTAFDAAFNDYWLPGGYTVPLDNCNTKYRKGCKEFVHAPLNTFKDILELKIIN